jgi:hypothetical protein
MWMTLFLSIMHKLSKTSPYFSERYDATGRIGLTALQKCTAVVCQLAYDMTTYMIDEYLKLGKSIDLECLEYYCISIIECFRVEFLRRPTVADTQCLLAKVEEHRFTGMLVYRLYELAVAQLFGRLTNPIYTGDNKHHIIILEVVASHNRWI